MKNNIKEKILTKERIKRDVERLKALMSDNDTASMKTGVEYDGKEMLLETEEGIVRVLAYNMEKTEILPLFINIHGGGFVMGSAEMDDPFMMNVANNANVKILSVDYSLSPDFPFPKALKECYGVAKYAKDNWRDLVIDPDNIAIGGHSAGGNLSAAVCLMDNQRKQLDIKCLILDYPPVDLYTDAELKPLPSGSFRPSVCRLFDASYCEDKEERKNPLISPLYASTDQLRTFPPTLIITASNDSLCQEGEKFKDKLAAAGVDVTHKRFEGRHAFNFSNSENARESWQMMIDHLKRYLVHKPL